MPRATFTFGDPSRPHTMEVDCRWWGRERYSVDGKVLDSRWSMAPAGAREFQVGRHKVKIDVSVKEYSTRVFVDDRLHVEELFPEVKARLEKWQKPPYSWLGPAIVGAIFLFLILWL